MKCLVLGGGGFIGSHICEGLLEAGHSVRVLERKDSDKTNLKHLRDIELIEGDFTDIEALKIAISDVEIVFHLISTTLPKNSNEDMLYDLTSNVGTTVKLLELAHQCGVKKVIFASSGGTVYGKPKLVPICEEHPTNPTCSYGIHKLAIEKYLALFHDLYGLDYAVLRISNPFGERQKLNGSQGAIAVFLSKALKNEKIQIWGDGSVVRDYIYISDVVDAALKVMNLSTKDKIFNIGSGKGHTLNEIINSIEEVIGTKLEIQYTPARDFDVPVNVLDISLAKERLNWEPKNDFTTGLRRFVDYLK